MCFLRPKNKKDEISKSKDKSENVTNEKYENTICDLKSEIQIMKSKKADLSKPKEEAKDRKVEPTKSTPTISKKEAKKKTRRSN
jgi:hypothetical protein